MCCVVLGDVQVERGEQAKFIAHDTSDEAQWIAFIDAALGITGLPSDIANVVLLLASDLSRWMSGAELVDDGAMAVS